MDQKMMLEQSASGDFDPYASADEGQKAIQAFAKALEQLRDDHKIHHLVCMVAVEVGPQDKDGGSVTQGALAFGNNPQQCQRLVTDGYRIYVIPAIQWGEALKRAADPTISDREIRAGMGVNRQ